MPKPVWIITPAIKKALTTSQVVESPYPFKASLIGTNPDTVEKIKEDKQYNIMIAHANDLENGKKLLNCLLTNHSNIKKHYILELGGALGAHTGPGGLAIGIQEI